MKNNVNRKRRKRYRIVNKFKFIRFIAICISLLAITFVNLFNKPVEKIETVDVPIITNLQQPIYAAPLEELEIKTDEQIVDYSKKPELLKTEYYDYIIELSNIEEIPSAVILAIITTENSTYKDNITYKNKNGTVDIGLCQINSAYIEYFADKYNIEHLDPYSAYDSILFVARHIKYLSDYGKDKYNLSDYDSYVFAAGAYNRGLGGECKYRNMYHYKEKFINNYNKFI